MRESTVHVRERDMCAQVSVCVCVEQVRALHGHGDRRSAIHFCQLQPPSPQ